jgi:hypothetical protein
MRRAHTRASGRRSGLRTSHQLVEHIDDVSPGDACRWTFQKISQGMFDRALRLFAVALAAMCEVELGPLADQTPKAQRRFGALAVILSLEP